MLPTQSAWYSGAKALMLCDERVAGSGHGAPHRKTIYESRDHGKVWGGGEKCGGGATICPLLLVRRSSCSIADFVGSAFGIGDAGN